MKSLAPRTIVGDRYEILAPLGSGGMGRVYRARHLGLDMEVALKVLAAGNSTEFEARFEREARALARLDHPGCVRVIDYGHAADATPYLVMEHVAGATLSSVLRAEGRFSAARALQVTKSLLSALAHAHARGVLHRDVKPDNVMLVTEGTPRTVLIDFGLACVRDELPLTASGMCIGSPAYIAPERLLGHAYDARADLYAAGVLLYELLAGAKPFSGSSPEETMHQQLHRPHRPLRAVRRDLSPALDGVVRRALSREPDSRFADAEEMRAALDDLAWLDARPRVAVRAVRAAPGEDAATVEVSELSPYRPPWWARLWSWLRYGPWRLRRYTPSAEISASLKP